MITRLPRWVWPVAWWLAFVAGAVNAIGLVGVGHLAVSHLTGTTTLLAAAVATATHVETLRLVAIAGAFVVGAVVSGLLIPTDPLRTGHRHTIVLLLTASSLGLAWGLFASHVLAGLVLAAAACGLQNAMTTAYSGAVVRTSHLSGMFTDLGIALGHALRGEAVERRRLALCATVITGFFGGGVAAVLLYGRFGYGALGLPTAMLVVLAIANTLHAATLRTPR